MSYICICISHIENNEFSRAGLKPDTSFKWFFIAIIMNLFNTGAFFKHGEAKIGLRDTMNIDIFTPSPTTLPREEFYNIYDLSR
jgi:hypothetical protein